MFKLGVVDDLQLVLLRVIASSAILSVAYINIISCVFVICLVQKVNSQLIIPNFLVPNNINFCIKINNNIILSFLIY